MDINVYIYVCIIYIYYIEEGTRTQSYHLHTIRYISHMCKDVAMGKYQTAVSSTAISLYMT